MIELYTTPYCPFCTQAKSFFDKKGLVYKDHDVSRNGELRKKVSAENGNWSTVPMIIVNGEFIGGFTDLVQADKSGKLSKLLQS